MNIKPIETFYNGYRFRSRTEARWAVFFDAAGIEYVYEPEGYDLGDAGWYLPDFWIPNASYRKYKREELKNNGVFLEIKPDETSLEDLESGYKYNTLAKQSGYPVVLVCGLPCISAYGVGEETTFPSKDYGIEYWGISASRSSCGLYEYIGWGDHGSIEDVIDVSSNEEGIYTDWHIYIQTDKNGVHFECCEQFQGGNDNPILFDRWVNAVSVAKSARFEHGETPSAKIIKQALGVVNG